MYKEKRENIANLLFLIAQIDISIIIKNTFTSKYFS